MATTPRVYKSTQLVVTWSALDTFQRCPRLYRYKYEDLKQGPVSEAMSFGSAVHEALEVIWGGGAPTSEDPVIDKMVGLYMAQVRPPADALPEIEFERQIPGMRSVRVRGKIDVVVPSQSLIVEHKTTSSKVDPSSAYWEKLPLDGQVSMYLWASDFRTCLYDVIRKPAIRIKKDETDDAFKLRQAESITADNFASAEVVRRDAQIGEFMDGVKATVRAIRRPPRPCHTHACFDWHRACEFYPVCCGEASLADYPDKVAAHTELGGNP